MAGLVQSVTIVVQQVPASLTATGTFSQPIVTLPVGASFGLSCKVEDRNGYPMSIPLTVSSRSGTVSVSACDSARVSRSGFDALTVTGGGLSAQVPIVVAAAPVVSTSIGDWLPMDSLPSGTGPWAPTLRRNSKGLLELYIAAYPAANDSFGESRGNLYRYVSPNGVSFNYDGIVLQHDSLPCQVNGSGIENIAIVPRSDSAGWRMYYSSGSFDCYGWQVFSAVSTDERTWVRESGPRIPNGGTYPPQGPVPPPWPSGEGMVVDQLPSGQWRMIVSTYEHVLPSQNKFQITEWQSNDQVNWTYVDPVLTTRQMPASAERSVYSPTISEVVPGLYRMIFTGDNLDQPGGRSALWSAVSLDKVTWQLEGQLIGGPNSNILYSSLVGNMLVFLRQDLNGTPRGVAFSTVSMP